MRQELGRSVADEPVAKDAGSAMINLTSKSNRLQESILHPSSHHATQKARGPRHMQTSKAQARAVKSGINFFNYTGTTVQLSASTDDLDEDMNLKRTERALAAEEEPGKPRTGSSAPLGTEIEKAGRRRQHQKHLSHLILKMEGARYNWAEEIKAYNRDLKFFQKKLASAGRHGALPRRTEHENLTTDFIEDEPLTIDIKIYGTGKICKIPVDRVGVYSYSTEAECLDDDNITSNDPMTEASLRKAIKER